MKRILIIRLTAMGDVAMTVPAVAALRAKYPDVRISILTTPFFQPFFRDVPDLDFVPFDKKGRHKGLCGIFRLWKDIHKQNDISAVADFHDVLRSKVLRTLFGLSGKKVAVINKGRAEKKALTAPGNHVLHPLKPTIDRYGDVLGRLGYPVEIPPKPKRDPRPVPPAMAEIAGTKAGVWIGIAPFAQHRGKIYPIDNLEILVKRLSQTPGATLFIFGGGPKEQAVADAWAAKYPNAFSAIGKMRLPEELDLISNLDGMVSMDSSAMHMASLCGVPVVSVWGATHPYAGFMGWGQSGENAVQSDLPCRPCSIYGNKPCRTGDYRCMGEITPGMIEEKIRQVAGLPPA